MHILQSFAKSTASVLRLAAVLSAAITWSASAQQDSPKAERHLIIGTAPVGGHYYPAGGALCRLVNAGRSQHGLRCLIEATSGAKENLTRLKSGDLAFALVQSDWQYHAYQSGVGTESDEGFAELRAVLSLQALPFTLVAAPGGGVESWSDLEGKRINLGPAGTPWRTAADFLVEALGWSHDDFAGIGELPPEEQAAGLCDGRIDAALLPASHPSGLVAQATETCGARLVSINGEGVNHLLAEWSFYAPAVIPGGLYANNPDPVTSFGLRATLVAPASLPEESVYEVTRAVFEGLESLREQYSVFADLRPEDMVSAGVSAPLHQGALRYYQERGWR